MGQSVKLRDDLASLVRQEAKRQSRSMSGQLAHWLALGCAVERSGQFDTTRILEALAPFPGAEPQIQDDETAWLDDFTDRMAQASADEQAFFELRQTLGRGVGLDAQGNFIDARADHTG